MSKVGRSKRGGRYTPPLKDSMRRLVAGEVPGDGVVVFHDVDGIEYVIEGDEGARWGEELRRNCALCSPSAATPHHDQ